MLRSSAQGVDPPVCRVLDVAGKMLRSSAQGVDPPVCRTPGCYCYICKRQLCGFPQCAASWMTYARDSFVDSPSGAFCPLEGGGPDTLAPVLQHFNYKINKHKTKVSAPHGQLPHTKHK